MTPNPTMPTKASAPPCVTGSPSGNPHARAFSAVNPPITSPIFNISFGHLSNNSSIPNRANIVLGGVSPSKCHRAPTLFRDPQYRPVSFKLT